MIQPIPDKAVVERLIKKSNRVLATIWTHRFPIDLFPDSVTVQEAQVTVIIRNFFMSSQVHSVDLKDISNTFINMTPFFAQLVIVSKTFTENEIHISNLFKSEAIYIRKLIEGLRTLESKKVDTAVYSAHDLVAKLQELNTTEIVN